MNKQTEVREREREKMDERTRAHLERIIRTCSPLVDDGIEEPQKEIGFSPLRDDIEVPSTRKKKRRRPPPVLPLSLIEMRQKNEAFLVDQKSLPLVQRLLDDIEAEKECEPLALMTPYSDAAWLATIWPCQREAHHHQCGHECNRPLLHDGSDWYLWNDQTRRWEVVDQLMYRLVAECCTLPYRRLNTASKAEVERLTLLLQRGYPEKTETKGGSSTIGRDLQKHLDTCRWNHRHLERLHSLAYQKKVLAIAGKIFFSLPSSSSSGCWGPNRNLLPLHDGTVLSSTEDGRFVKRQAVAGDRLKSTTPTLPRAVIVLTEWMAKWRSTDLRQLQCILGRALLLSLGEEDPRSCRTLILWGVDEETCHQFISFLRTVVGPHYCSFGGVRNSHTRIAVETLIPKSEQHLLSSLFKQDLLTRVEASFLLTDILTIVMVGSVQNKIFALPVEFQHPSSQCVVPKNVGMIRAGDRFWGAVTPLCLTHEEDPSSTEIVAVIDTEPLAWLIDGIIIP